MCGYFLDLSLIHIYAASRYLHANLPKGTKSLPIAEWEKEYATLSGQRTAEYAQSG